MGHGLQYIKSLFMLPAHIVVLPSLRSQSFFTAVSSFHQVVLHHFYYFSLSKLDLCTIVLNSALRFPVKRRKMMVVFLKKCHFWCLWCITVNSTTSVRLGEKRFNGSLLDPHSVALWDAKRSFLLLVWSTHFLIISWQWLKFWWGSQSPRSEGRNHFCRG